MKLIHLADLHLGFNQFQRLTPAGLNQRQADVADAFRRAIDLVIARAPEIVVIAGDVFHQVRPSNPTILHAFEQLRRLTTALPETIVVMIAGNHDTPRAAETGCILRLFEQLGIHVADREAQQFCFAERDLSILAVPECVSERPAFEPNPDARTNILLTHLEVTDIFAGIPLGDEESRKGLKASVAEMGPERWDYIAVGHYHVLRELAPNAYYAGSLEYTSTNPWAEIAEEHVTGKRIVEYDLADRTARYHRIEHNRQLIDLPIIGAHGMSARDLDDAIQANAASGFGGGIDGAIVRQRVLDCSPALKREIDYTAIRALQKRALNYELDTRKPEIVRMRGTTAFTRKKPLDEMLREVLGRRILTDTTIPREALVARAVDYLDEATALESRKPGGALIDMQETLEIETPHVWERKQLADLGCEAEVCHACGQVRHQFENGGCPGASLTSEVAA